MNYQKFLFNGSVVIFSLFLTIEVFAQNLDNSEQIQAKLQTIDWSVLFPEIPGCKPKIQAWQFDDFVEVQAYYLYVNKDLNRSNQREAFDYCGKISFAFSVSGKSIKPHSKTPRSTPFYRPFKIKNYDAYSSYLKCGVGSQGESIDVFFDDDKKLSVTSKVINGAIFKFAERVDYKKINLAIVKIANSIKQK